MTLTQAQLRPRKTDGVPYRKVYIEELCSLVRRWRRRRLLDVVELPVPAPVERCHWRRRGRALTNDRDDLLTSAGNPADIGVGFG